MHNEDNEGNYRHYLALLVGSDKSSMGAEQRNQFMNDCRVTAEQAFPKGAAAARKRDMSSGGILGALATVLSISHFS